MYFVSTFYYPYYFETENKVGGVKGANPILSPKA